MQLVALFCRFMMFATDALLSAAVNSLAVGLNRCPPLPRMTENRFCKKGKCTIVRVNRHCVEQNVTDIVWITSKQSWLSLDVQRYFTPSDISCWWSLRMLLMLNTSPVWQGGVIFLPITWLRIYFETHPNLQDFTQLMQPWRYASLVDSVPSGLLHHLLSIMLLQNHHVSN